MRRHLNFWTVTAAVIAMAGIFAREVGAWLPGGLVFVGAWLPLNRLRRVGLYWLAVMLLAMCAGIGWIALVQPSLAEPVGVRGWVWLGIGVWITLYLLTYRIDEARDTISVGRWAGLLVSLVTLALLLFGVELALRYVFVQTDSFGTSRMSQTWKAAYWETNSRNMRDIEQVIAAETPHIVFTGDSFTAGHGLNDVNDRYVNIVRAQAAVPVVMLADNGADTFLQVQWLRDYPHTPEALVASYYFNDVIQAYIVEHGPLARAEPPPPLVSQFFISDFLYWHAFNPLDASYTNYAQTLVSAYDDPAVWGLHSADLRSLADWAAERDVPLILLLWPNLADLDVAAPALEKVGALMTEQGATVIDMTPLAAELPVRARVVNPLDTHPSAALHARAAQIILQQLIYIEAIQQ